METQQWKFLITIKVLYRPNLKESLAVAKLLSSNINELKELSKKYYPQINTLG